MLYEEIRLRPASASSWRSMWATRFAPSAMWATASMWLMVSRTISAAGQPSPTKTDEGRRNKNRYTSLRGKEKCCIFASSSNLKRFLRHQLGQSFICLFSFSKELITSHLLSRIHQEEESNCYRVADFQLLDQWRFESY